jgi:RNA polymerase sigma-70 factor (ECF subfamily)
MSERHEAALAEAAPDLLSYFRRRIGDDDAPDQLAETLATAWRRIRMMPEDPEGARRWLFGIAHHTLLNYTRGVRRRHGLADRIRGALTVGSSAPAADDGLEVRDAIARLEPRLAELVRLVHWEGFTLAEAADVLGVPASTARNHYQTAKRQLRLALTAELDCAAPAPSQLAARSPSRGSTVLVDPGQP